MKKKKKTPHRSAAATRSWNFTVLRQNYVSADFGFQPGAEVDSMSLNTEMKSDITS